MLFGMQVCCDCSYPIIIGMDPEGIFDSDFDDARCYAWRCPECHKRTLVRMDIVEDDEE